MSKSGTSVAREATDSSDDALEVLRGEVSGSQVLNHVIEDEKSELEALLLTAAEAAGNDLVTKACNKSCDVISVSLEKAAHKLSSRDLQIKLVGVLFLDQSHIISIQSIVLVLDLLLRECQVLGNSFERLGDNINGFISKVSDLFGSHKTGTGDINHILEGLNLDDQSVSVEFSLHGLVNVCVENFGHSVKLLNRDVTCLACLHQSWEGTGTVLADRVIGVERSKTEEESTKLFNVVEDLVGGLVNEDGKHLKCNILLLDLVSDNRHVFFSTINACTGWGNFSKHISELSECILTGDTHGWVKCCHGKDRGENLGQVLTELLFHEESDTLPCAQKVNSLRVTLIQSSVLDLKHNINKIGGN